MDNRINEIRCKMGVLRFEMTRVEDAMRDQRGSDPASALAVRISGRIGQYTRGAGWLASMSLHDSTSAEIQRDLIVVE